MHSGRIKKLVPDRGFGFIRCEGVDTFFTPAPFRERSLMTWRKGRP